MTQLRPLQHLFNVVIHAGYFKEESCWPECSSHMCDALLLARRDNVITELEHDYLISEIKKYMDELLKDVEYEEEERTLLKIYKLLGKDSTPKARMWVYLNWDNRPYFAPHQ